MAQAKGHVLNVVRGRLDNTKPHYAFVRNGKQFIGCVRNGWNTELITDTQKITALNFAYASAVGCMVAAAEKAGRSQNFTPSIGYAFRTVKVGKINYFFDDTLFTNLNNILADYFTQSPFFVVSGIFAEDFNIYTVNPAIAAQLPKKTALRYSLTSLLMQYADRLDLPQIYDRLSKVKAANYTEEPLQYVWEDLRLLQMDLWRWATVEVMTVTPQNYDKLLQDKANGIDHRDTFAAYIEEKTWRMP